VVAHARTDGTHTSTGTGKRTRTGGQSSRAASTVGNGRLTPNAIHRSQRASSGGQQITTTSQGTNPSNAYGNAAACAAASRRAACQNNGAQSRTGACGRTCCFGQAHAATGTPTACHYGTQLGPAGAHGFWVRHPHAE
jgi:hypothetical protein